MRRTTLALLLWLSIPLSSVFAGALMDIDYACFRAEDSLSYVEVFASIQRAGLYYQPRGDSSAAEFSVILEVLQDSVSMLADTFAAVDILDTASVHHSAGQYFAHVFQLFMKSGVYNLRAAIYQNSSDPRDTYSETLRVPFYKSDTVLISDIELGSDMAFSDEESPLVKNGIRLVPNPTRFYGTQMPMLYYYAEAYGLAYDSAAPDSHEVVRRIVDAETGKMAKQESRKTVKTRGRTAVLTDGFPLTTLRTGTYFIELSIRSLRNSFTASVRKPFWMFRKEDFEGGRTPKSDSGYRERLQGLEPNFLDIMNADTAVMWMKYILTRDEAKQVERLTADGKRAFLIQFWKQREAEGSRKANDYYARVIEANRRYSFLKMPGWKTDRGRILILYGEPDNINRNYATAELPDHEEWQYHQLEGEPAVFIFLDRNGFGDLDLVHSTKRGEIYNPNWYDLSPAARRNASGGR
jgi:GWxTD domain-containing protein